MKIAFWTVTREAGKIAKDFSSDLSKELKNYIVDVYTLKKFKISETIEIENFSYTIEKKFNEYDGHIFIMASGIVVRKISKLLKSKDIDPAVLLIDEGKNFVISLLSGHLGGANKLTKDISEILNLIPVITTSSDISGKIAVDTISQKINAKLEDLNSAKEVTALIVDGKKVEILLPKNVKLVNNLEKSYDAEGIILITNKNEVKITRLFPTNLIIGIGCKKNTPENEIIKAIEESMSRNNLDMRSIKHIATIDVKEKEEGLISAARFLKKDLVIVSSERVKEVEHMFEGSDFVKKNIGVSAVSEPVAYLTSNKKGKFIEKKAKFNGITVSIFEEELQSE